MGGLVVRTRAGDGFNELCIVELIHEGNLIHVFFSCSKRSGKKLFGILAVEGVTVARRKFET